MQLVLDSSPLIYLAKLDALDAVSAAGHDGVVPPAVLDEVARLELAFRFPEVATIARARDEGRLAVLRLGPDEARVAAALADRYGGLHAGELEVLALGQARGWLVCFHERQAGRLARSLGLVTVHLVQILFAGTRDVGLLERRVRQFARLTNLRMDDLDELLRLIEDRR